MGECKWFPCVKCNTLWGVREDYCTFCKDKEYEEEKKEGVEVEDWNNARNMSIEDAIKLLDNESFIRGYLGSYTPDSTEEYHFNKAKIYYAIDKLIDFAKEKCE